MTSNNINNTATDAVIHLKNGQRKYGVLVGDKDKPQDPYHFISNFNLLNTVVNKEFLEVIPGFLIESIDTDLK